MEGKISIDLGHLFAADSDELAKLCRKIQKAVQLNVEEVIDRGDYRVRESSSDLAVRGFATLDIVFE
jgi:hypothetical protein